MRLLTALTLTALVLGGTAAFAAFEFDGQGDNQTTPYYYAATGGKFPTGNAPNGDNASGGTFRYLLDDPDWGAYPLNQWNKDDWFPENAGLALTLMQEGAIVYDNNGIEDGTTGGFYDYSSSPNYFPGLYMAYSMPNNWDWIYASYFKLAEETTFDTVVGYMDDDGFGSGWDPTLPNVGYRVSIWSAYQDLPYTRPDSWMPAVASFTGDVFDSDVVAGSFFLSDSGVDRIFPTAMNRPNEDIWRLALALTEPVTLPEGIYFFSHQAYLATEIDIDIKPGSFPNSINLRSRGNVPVAVLTTDTFDAATVDPTTVYFAGAAPSKSKLEDVDGDGDMDLLLHFPTPNLMLTGDSTEAGLRGFTYDGEPVLGSDSVKIPKGGKK